jgi:hypothetical protein
VGVWRSCGKGARLGECRDRLAPPVLKLGAPLDVEVKLHVDEIPLISSTDDQYQPEGFLDVAWCDPRFSADLTAEGERRVYANQGAIDYLKGIWQPQITFINEVVRPVATISISRFLRMDARRFNEDVRSLSNPTLMSTVFRSIVKSSKVNLRPLPGIPGK